MIWNDDAKDARLLWPALQKVGYDLLVLNLAGPACAALVAPRAREIHWGAPDAVKLDAYQQWLEARAAVAQSVATVSLALGIEGQTPTLDTITRRLAETERKITQLILCNPDQPDPLANHPWRYDLIIARPALWPQFIRRVQPLLASDGWLFITTVTTGVEVRKKFAAAGYDRIFISPTEPEQIAGCARRKEDK